MAYCGAEALMLRQAQHEGLLHLREEESAPHMRKGLVLSLSKDEARPDAVSQ
jgi:hypothetical protein